MPTESKDKFDDIKTAAESAMRDGTRRSPPVEIIEDATAFVLTAFIPYADREDIRVDVSPHRVVIAAMPRSPATAAMKVASVPYQDFELAIPLPDEVDPEAAEARLNNGVLEAIMPKKKHGGTGVYRLPAM